LGSVFVLQFDAELNLGVILKRGETSEKNGEVDGSMCANGGWIYGGSVMNGEFLKEWGYGEVRDKEIMCM